MTFVVKIGVWDLQRYKYMAIMLKFVAFVKQYFKTKYLSCKTESLLLYQHEQ